MTENIDSSWLGEDEIYKENIIDHFKNPQNFGRLESYSIKNQKYNAVCGDQLEISVFLTNDRVTDVKFYGKGCAISMAAASMLTEKIKNMTIEEIKKLSDSEVLKMIGVPLGVVRMKCGLLALRALQEGIANMEVTNEQINS